MRSLAGDPLPSTTSNASSRPPFSTVEDCLDRIHADGPEPLSSDSLRQDILWFATLRRPPDDDRSSDQWRADAVAELARYRRGTGRAP